MPSRSAKTTPQPTSKTTTPTTELARQLAALRLPRTAEDLDDFLARATKRRWSPRTVLEDAPSATARPDAGGERTCLRLALAPILVLVLAHFAFEVTGFGLAELDESVAAHLTSTEGCSQE